MLTIESITRATGAFIVFMNTEGRVQLWRPMQGQNMQLDSELKVAMSPAPPTTANSTQSSIGTADQDIHKPPSKVLGTFAFVQNYLKDCPISLIAVYGQDIFGLALHAPSDADGAAVVGGQDHHYNQNDIYYGEGDFGNFGTGYKSEAPSTVDGFFDKKREEDDELQAERRERRAQKEMQVCEHDL